MTNPNKKIKIALIGFRLGHGGMEKVAANLSNYLFENKFDVHHIIMENAVEYKFSGTLHNIGLLKNKRNSFLNKITRFFALKKILTHENFQLIIDFRYRTSLFQEFFILKFAYNSPTIFTVHSSELNQFLFKNKIIANYFLKRKSHCSTYKCNETKN